MSHGNDFLHIHARSRRNGTFERQWVAANFFEFSSSNSCQQKKDTNLTIPFVTSSVLPFKLLSNGGDMSKRASIEATEMYKVPSARRDPSTYSKLWRVQERNVNDFGIPGQILQIMLLDRRQKKSLVCLPSSKPKYK
jgi:hypothetical protein